MLQIRHFCLLRWDHILLRATLDSPVWRNWVMMVTAREPVWWCQIQIQIRFDLIDPLVLAERLHIIQKQHPLNI